MASLADVKKKLKAHFSDLGQLVERGSPLNNDYQNLKQRVSRHIPRTEDFRSPQSMSEWSQAAALNAPMGLSTKLPPTKYSKAHDIAQRNAALPVEQGGLGLPANNTAMDRAKALGFDTEAYHGSKNNISEFMNLFRGKNTDAMSATAAHFSASNPDTANTYAALLGVNDLPLLNSVAAKNGPIKNKIYDLKDKLQELYADSKIKDFSTFLETEQAKNINSAIDTLTSQGYMNMFEKGKVYPLKLKPGNSKIKDYKGNEYRDSSYYEELKNSNGFDSVTYKNTYDNGAGDNPFLTDVYAIKNPKNIRSKFAAFDPMKKDSADILASAAGAGVVAKALSGDEAEAGDNMRNNVSDSLLHAVMMQESGGNPNAVSSKGARGLYQIMDATARNPGFGVEPLRNNSITDQERFAKDYLGAMLERYDGNLPVSLAAYNAGPGAVDKASVFF